MRKLKINQMNFEMASEMGDNLEATAYLDSETGDILYLTRDVTSQLDDILSNETTLESCIETIQAQDDIPNWQIEQMVEVLKIEWDEDERYIQISKQDSRGGYKEMEDFIASLNDERMQELLETAIQGKGAFGRFKGAISRYPDIEEKWFEFRDNCHLQRMTNWLKSVGIKPEFE